MASVDLTFEYVAFDTAGKRVKGSITAPNEGSAFEQLKRQGLAPVRLRAARKGARRRSRELSDREASGFLSDLAALLKAGTDVRTSLSVIGAKSESAAVNDVCKGLGADIGAGVALERAFSRSFGQKHAFVPALVAAGESASDIAGGLERAADLLTSQVKLRDQLVSVLSYPAFVLATSVVALSAILLFVVPALAPLVQQPGVEAPLLMKVLIGLSGFIRSQALMLVGLAIAGLAALVVMARLGVLAAAIDEFVVIGPFRRISSALIYGGFAISLGNMLAAGAPMADALRLATRSISSPGARRRIERVAQSVRQGQRLSETLVRVPGFPQSIVRLAAIGEASGSLGPMIARAGRIEEDAALRRIEAAGRLIGPAVIVVLGGFIGLIMGGLLTSITHIGDAALQ